MKFSHSFFRSIQNAVKVEEFRNAHFNKEQRRDVARNLFAHYDVCILSTDSRVSFEAKVLPVCLLFCTEQ